MSDQTVPGYEANQLQEAYAWAVDRTVERYAYSNLWRPPGDRAEFTNQSLFFITEYLTGDAEDLVVGSIASNAAFEENQEKLSTLIPQPSSDLSAANWLSPAVSDWKLGEPVFSAVDNGGLQVAVPYSAVGVFEQNGSYYAISIQDVSVYTLTSVAGQWRISQWESQPVFSEPAKLSGKPVDRTLASYAPTDIANDATSNPLDLDSLEPYAP